MPDFLDEKRQEIAARLKGLKPLVEEYARLEAAASALGGIGSAAPARGKGSATPSAAASRKRARPRGSKNAAAPARAKTAPTKAKGKSKAGRRKGSGARAAQVLTLVQEQPGIKIPELAQRMGIKQNYLYRVLPSLNEEGKVEQREDRGWHLSAA